MNGKRAVKIVKESTRNQRHIYIIIRYYIKARLNRWVFSLCLKTSIFSELFFIIFTFAQSDC